MEPTRPLGSPHTSFESGDDPIDVIGALGLAGFVSGEEPVAVARSLQRVRGDATLTPPGIEPSRLAVSERRRTVLATGPGWTLVAKIWWDQTAYVTVSAVSRDLATDVLTAATDGAEIPGDPSSDVARVHFWHLSQNGPRRVEREIETPEWPGIRANYTAPVAGAIDSLMALDRPVAGGRLLLMHGPPGTGKTTILRALARQWQPWCSLHHVVDPERLLGQPGYLLDVLARRTDDDDDDGSDERWRLLVLEDCDELIRAEAKAGSGQSLARLLNLTDGMLGQGAKVLVCITTNESLGRLHPAVTRPGRCLAEVAVGPLSRPEARRWLGRNLPAGAEEGATLAQLYAWQAGDGPLRAAATPVPSGAYL